MDDINFGELVWAQLGRCKMWPGIVIRGSDCGKNESTNCELWIFWYGDHRHSLVPTNKMVSFAPNFAVKYKDQNDKNYSNGVIEAIAECAHRVRKNAVLGNVAALLNWAQKGFRPYPQSERFLPPDLANPVPEILLKSRYMKANPQLLSRDNSENAIQKVHNGRISVDKICIACYRDDISLRFPHPLFHGSLCLDCKEAVRENIYIKDDGESYKCCAICGIGGDMIICDNTECNRVYCNTCVNVLVGPEEFTNVQAQDPWDCYLCKTTNDQQHGILVKRKDWKDNLFKFYQPIIQPQVTNLEFPMQKRPMRVLSLFDGITTGKVALDNLGIIVQEYYAAEIDQDAINVSRYHHDGVVKYLGRVQTLTDEQVSALCPIDLLIGGSPCNDLSLVNPARKGLYDVSGSGILFFEYYRILQKIIKMNKNRPVFWLFENVQQMEQEHKNVISRFLGCEPALIDAIHFSAQTRARCFWGNIPDLHKVLPAELMNREHILDSALINQCDRTAAVKVIQTVTTRSNSLRQGKDNIQPVRMNGLEDGLWAIELERIFGFPFHYTDVGIAPTRRQVLLGKAWSVQVIEHILSPLKEYFATETKRKCTACQGQGYISNVDLNAERTMKKQRHD